MLKLKGEKIYLAALERADCKKLYEDIEYDFNNPTEYIVIGQSIENADAWYEEIQKLLKDNVNIRLGIFLNSGEVIGDVALQSVNEKDRSCSIGIGIAKIENRSKGYGTEAIKLILNFAFSNLGFERIEAETWEINPACQKALEKLGFVLEGRARKAVYFGGKRFDMFKYGLLIEEWKLK